MSDFPPSPVPGDAELWPGELPFTAWGQHEPGVLDLRVLQQAIWWVDFHQRPHRLVDMADDYVRNVIHFLERDVDYFFAATQRAELLQRLGDHLLGRRSTSEIAEALGAPPLSALTPTEWLEATPLMRALRRRASRQ